LNDVRKGKVAAMVKEMKHTLDNRDEIKNVIVLGNPHWQPALLGLAAMNIMEKHSRPVFLWGREGNGLLKGSARSDGSINLVSMMRNVKEGVLLGFGGHAFSGGFSVIENEIHFLEEHFNEAFEKTEKNIVDEDVEIDGVLSLDEVNDSLYNSISLLAPFGVDNPKPMFMFQGVTPEKIRMFGKNEEHLELTFRKTNGDFVRAIEFFSNRDIKENKKIDLVAVLEKSTFGRYPELRLRIVDIL
jgi:single-stranded-DNA-specific exonuclease